MRDQLNPLNIVQEETQNAVHYFRMNVLDPKAPCVVCRLAADASIHVTAGKSVLKREG